MQKEIKFELTKDNFVSEDNEKYTSFGVRVLENSDEIANFSDLSLNKDVIIKFVNLLSGKEYSKELMQCLVEALVTYGIECQ